MAPKQEKHHIVFEVREGSIAAEMEIEKGDELLSVNGEKIEDIFDYRFLTEDENITLLIRKPNGEEWELDIEKDEDEDLGIEFENGLMDDYRSCSNHCIFCFIDQMPVGMRKSLYFKDDDSRLSFLQGNYVTLTNLSDHDIDRIIKYRLSPVNISFHTTNPELRCRMLNNRFAGEAIKKAERLFNEGIRMNGQIVLCKGINDGAELNRTIGDLTRFIPCLESVSVVPVGLTRYRDKLYPLSGFDKEDADKVLKTVHDWQDKCYKDFGTHFIHAGDEFYILAGRDMPAAETYDGYLQYENGVGMVRSFVDEFYEALEDIRENPDKWPEKTIKRDVSMAGGVLFNREKEGMIRDLKTLYPEITVRNYAIKNNFFGEKITVSGLLTGKDIIEQLSGKELGNVFFLPENLLRSGTDVLLDDLTLNDISEKLNVRVDTISSDGWDFAEKILRG